MKGWSREPWVRALPGRPGQPEPPALALRPVFADLCSWELSRDLPPARLLGPLLGRLGCRPLRPTLHPGVWDLGSWGLSRLGIPACSVPGTSVQDGDLAPGGCSWSKSLDGQGWAPGPGPAGASPAARGSWRGCGWGSQCVTGRHDLQLRGRRRGRGPGQRSRSLRGSVGGALASCC